MKVLSKSRFKIGADCPNKLYYTFHKEEFPSTKEEDTFLQALAQGGFQVEELARMLSGGLADDSARQHARDMLAAKSTGSGDRMSTGPSRKTQTGGTSQKGKPTRKSGL